MQLAKHTPTHTVYIELHGGRQGGRQGRSEEGGREGGREVGREVGRDGGRDGRTGGQGTAGNVKGGILRRKLASIQYIPSTNHPTTRPLPLRLWYYKMKNSEQV